MRKKTLNKIQNFRICCGKMTQVHQKINCDEEIKERQKEILYIEKSIKQS